MSEQKTRAEVAQERADALEKQYKSEFEESQKAAIDARGDQPDQAETEEEYYERIRQASTSGIFGDTDTTAGVGASGTDVPVANNEEATKAVAAVDAAAEQGDEEAADTSTDEARRQVGPDSAQEVDEAADDNADEEKHDDIA